jgi:hypothetical protein
MTRRCFERQGTHARLHGILGIEQPRKIMKDILDVAIGAEAGHGKPGGLGLGAHQGEVLADQGVEERGFADVGSAGKGDVATAGMQR